MPEMEVQLDNSKAILSSGVSSSSDLRHSFVKVTDKIEREK
jgi:hypothetical protein